ncbi:MAG: hypothetical protein Q4F39_06300 [Bacteroidia bacterium]|nr:hypothetical protein [Bacteroidia bacterium]
MKIIPFASLLGTVLISMMMIMSCQVEFDPDDTSNAQILRQMNQQTRAASMNDDIEFIILTPNGLAEVGYKNFAMSAEEGDAYKELDGTSFFAVTSAGRYANDMFSIMVHSQNLSKSQSGDKLVLKKVSCGNFASNNSDIAFGTFEGGDIFVKNISDTTITLRFVKVKTRNGLGDTYFNGDLTFDIQ